MSYAFPSSGPQQDPVPPAPQLGSPQLQTVAQPSTARRVLRLVGAAVLGVVVGALGTVMFQALSPLGLILALAASLAAGLTARAWAGFGTLGAYVIGWVVAVQVLSAKGPGGDVIVPGGHAASYVWVYGGFLLAFAAAVAPRSWFASAPAISSEAAPDVSAGDALPPASRP